MKIDCCQDCQKREIGCHASCSEYIATALVRDIDRRERWERDSAMYDAVCLGITTRFRRMRRKLRER